MIVTKAKIEAAEQALERHMRHYSELEKDALDAICEPGYFDNPQPREFADRSSAPARYMTAWVFGAQALLLKLQADYIAELEQRVKEQQP